MPLRSAACWRTTSRRRSTCRRSTARTSTALRCAPPTLWARPTPRRSGFASTPRSWSAATRRTPASTLGTATTIATGGVVPRGADAVVMVEQTELVEGAEPAVDVRRAASPGQFISYAGSDIARGEVVLRRGARIGSREIGMLAACGIAEVDVVRRPRVAVLSTGDELVPPGEPLRPAAVYDSNGAIVAAAVQETGGEAVPFGSFPDDEVTLELASARRARDLRHGAALRRHLEGRWRSLASRGVAARRAGRGRARRCAQARQAALPRGGGRQAAGGAAGLPDLGDLHLPCLRRAGDPRQGRPAAGSVAQRRGRGAGAHSLRARPQGIRAGRAGRGRARAGRVPDRQGLGLGDELLAGRRLPRDRRARIVARRRHARDRHADRAGGGDARSRRDGLERHRARYRRRQARRAGLRTRA